MVSLSFALPPDYGETISVTHRVVGSGEEITLSVPKDGSLGVIGGERTEAGEWPDAVAVVFNGQFPGCMGTLIAPDVVLTAAHCAGGITHVLVGSRNLQSEQGELIVVDETIIHPGYVPPFGPGADIAVLRLGSNSTYPTRMIANDCVIDQDLHDDAHVSIVGFGTIDQNGEVPTTFLMEGEHHVRDHDCSEDQLNGKFTGCDPDLRPNGELIAGGGGIDACGGDSGGPLYLHTENRGSFVTGVVSRAMAGVDFYCGQGGIWTRPDAFMTFIENRSGVTMPRPQCNAEPTASAGPIAVQGGDTGVSTISFEDPDGDEFTVEVVEESDLGSVEIDGDEIVFTAHKDAVGTDVIRIRVTDAGNPNYSNADPISVEFDVEVDVTEAPAGGCACQASGSGMGGVLGGMVVLALGLLRRNRVQ